MYIQRKLKYVSSADGIEAARLTDILVPEKIISIVGGGGKTSTLFQLGLELASKGKQCILTTTTGMYPIEDELPLNLRVEGKLNDNGKYGPPDNLNEFPTQSDYLIIEADGSRGLPVKMPENHEPAIFEKSDQIIAVAGLSGINRPIGSVCHRSHIVCDFLKKNLDDILSVDDIAEIIMNPKGLYKNVEGRKFTVILNQADTEEERTYAKRIAGLLPETVECIFTSYEGID